MEKRLKWLLAGEMYKDCRNKNSFTLRIGAIVFVQKIVSNSQLLYFENEYLIGNSCHR